MNIKLLTVLAMLACIAAYSQKTSWHHANSPYRAVYSITLKSNNPQCGVVIDVPHCGLGDMEGRDVFCYDEDGQVLKRAHLGRSSEGHALVLVRAGDSAKEIYAYFGSKTTAHSMDKYEPPLICELRTFPEAKDAIRSVAQAERQLEQSKVVARKVVDKIGEVANTMDSRDDFIMVFSGRYVVPKAGPRSLFIASSGPSYLYIDDKLEIDATGNRNVYANLRGSSRKSIELKAGTYDLKTVTFARKIREDGQVFGIALGRAVTSGQEVSSVLFVQGADFVQGGRAVLRNVEAHNRNSGIPAFLYEHKSYMALENAMLTETEFRTYSGQEAVWEFGDKVVLKGASVTRIFAGLTPMTVKATVKRTRAEGMVLFPENAPPARKAASSTADFDAYAAILEKQNVGKIQDPAALQEILHFLQWRDCHPLCIPVAQALLKSKKCKGAEREEALLCLARSGSVGGAGSPAADAARDAYLRLLKDSRGEKRDERVSEAVEFALYGLRDMALAESWLKTYGGKLPAKLNDALMMDVFLQSGRIPEAQAKFQKLLEGKHFGANQKSSAVRGASFQEAAERAIEQGRLLDARLALRQWAAEAPMDRSNGSLSLVRAKVFRKLKWLAGAEGELIGAVKADRELPFLPDVEFELATVYSEMGRQAEARALFGKVAEKYPNHPLAKIAEKKK